MARVEHLSHSSLEDIRSCSLKFKLRKLDKVPQRPSWSLIGGRVVHLGTEVHDKRELGMPVEEFDFASVFEAETREQEESSGCSRRDFYRAGRRSKENPNKEDDTFWLREGPRMVQRWASLMKVTPWVIWITPQGEPAIEIELLSEWGGVPNKGYLDRIFELPNRDLCVVDVKTGASQPKSNNQLGQYAHDVERLLGAKVKWGCYFQAREGCLTAPVSMDGYAERLHKDYQVAKRIVALDLFLASPSMLCGSCSVNADCPSFNPDAVLRIGPTT